MAAVFLDDADFRGVLPHTVHDKFDMATVQLQQLGFYQLGGEAATASQREGANGMGCSWMIYSLLLNLPPSFVVW